MGRVGDVFRFLLRHRARVVAIAGGVCAVIAWGLWCSIRHPGPCLTPAAVDSPVPGSENEISGVQVSACDPQADRRPLYSVAFDRLTADNGRIGVFRTPLFKVVTVEGLRFSLFTYGQGDSTAPTAVVEGKGLAGVAGLQHEVLDGLLARLKDLSAGCSPLIDVSNAAEVQVRGLDCTLYQDRRPRLAVRCHKALIAESSPVLELRGAVVITASDGARLESNCVNWNLGTGRFTAPGQYVLHQGGSPMVGRGLCCDQQLRITAGAVMEVKGGGNG
jgi:hypothetical protein